MRWLKVRILSAVAASALCLGVPAAASASFESPSEGDAKYAVSHIPGEVTKLLPIAEIARSKLKIADVEDVAEGDALLDIRDSVNSPTAQLILGAMRTALGGIKVLNGGHILTLDDVLRGNGYKLEDVVGVYVFPDKSLLVFTDSGRY